ncbi:MAG: hypothetical protein ACRCWR_12880 [Saezia sp.]
MPISPHHPKGYKKYLLTAAALLLAAALALLWRPSFSSSTPATSGYYTMQDHSLNDKNWQQTVADTFGIPKSPPAVDTTRTPEDYLNSCASWQMPAAPDAQSQEWYRAATTLQRTRGKSALEHQQMLQLYEGAARRGHYLAVKQLTIVYSTNWLIVMENQRFLPEPQKARYWINYGLKQKWTGALEWVANAILEGSAEFPHNTAVGMAYMQQAADKGVALAQWRLSRKFRNPNDVLKEEALLECAARQDLHAALHTFASYTSINKRPREALELYQRAVMAGGGSGWKGSVCIVRGI